MTSGQLPSAHVAALIDRYDAAWNAQDLDAIASLHDDAIVFHNHTAGERVAGAAAVRAHIGTIFARWPTLRFERRSLRCGADFAVSEWTARAVHPDDGRRLEWDGVDVFPLTAEHRIARKDVYSSSGTRACSAHELIHPPDTRGWVDVRPGRSLVLVSDNNFAASQFTQFLLFALDRSATASVASR